MVRTLRFEVSHRCPRRDEWPSYGLQPLQCRSLSVSLLPVRSLICIWLLFFKRGVNKIFWRFARLFAAFGTQIQKKDFYVIMAYCRLRSVNCLFSFIGALFIILCVILFFGRPLFRGWMPGLSKAGECSSIDKKFHETGWRCFVAGEY